jgi:hypothetical protein
MVGYVNSPLEAVMKIGDAQRVFTIEPIESPVPNVPADVPVEEAEERPLGAEPADLDFA